MGNILSSYYQKIQLLFEKKANLLMLGLDSAGKTTLLYKLKLDKVLQTTPTIGFNVETVKYKSLNMTMWDIGGQEKIRPLWRHYYDNVDGVIFIVDSNDCGRIEEVKKELHYIMSEDRLKNVKLLINKKGRRKRRIYGSNLYPSPIKKFKELIYGINNLLEKEFLFSC